MTGRSPRPRRLAILAGVGAALVLLAISVIARFQETERRQRLEIPLPWARIAPYPGTAKDLRATTSGSAFSRAFRVHFSAPAADIERWLRDSPGTRDVIPDRPSPGVRHFAIRPGGGAQHAEVRVEDATGAVSIYVYWS